MRTPLAASSRFSGSVSLSKKRPAPLRDAHVDDVAEAEAEQDALLHPDVDAPARRGRRVGLGRADPAERELVAQPQERIARLLSRRAASLLE